MLHCADKLGGSCRLPGFWRLAELTETLAAGAPEREARAQKAQPSPAKPQFFCTDLA